MQEVQEMQVPFLGQEDSLEKEMATHFNILAWRILWPKETGRLQSIGLRRFVHDFSNWGKEKKKESQKWEQQANSLKFQAEFDVKFLSLKADWRIILSSSEGPAFLLRPSIDWIRPTHIIDC